MVATWMAGQISKTLVQQMPSGTVGLWTFDSPKFATSPRPVAVNQMAGTQPLATNLWAWPRRSLSAAIGGNGANGLTVTDGTTSPYDASANASLLGVPTTADAQVSFNLGAGISTGGQFTIAYDIATTDGSTRTIRVGTFTNFNTYVITPTVQRIVSTFTLNALFVYLFWSPTSAASYTCAIDNIAMATGSSDPGREVLAGHMMFCNVPGGTLPGTGTAGQVDVSNGSGAVVQFLAPTTLTAYTAVAVGAHTTLTGQGHVEAFLSAIGAGYSQFAAPAMANGNNAGGGALLEFGGGSIIGDNAGFPWPRANEFHAITNRYGDGYATIMQDQFVLRKVADTGKSSTISDLLMGWVNAPTFKSNFKFAAAALVNRALNDTETAKLISDLTAYAQTNASVSIPSKTKVVTADGDSITVGTGSSDGLGSYVHRASPNLNTNIVLSDQAVGSAVLGTPGDAPGTNSLYGRKAADLALIPSNKAGRTYILSILIGRNDLVLGQEATYASNLSAYIAAMRTGGYDKVVLCTLLPSTAVNFNTARNTFNGIVTAGGWAAGNGVDALCRFDQVIGMGADADASGANYADGTHPANSGYILLEPTWRAAINAL